MAIIISTSPDPLASMVRDWRRITFTDGERPPILAEFHDRQIFYLEIDWDSADTPQATGYIGHVHALTGNIILDARIKATRWSATPDSITATIALDWR